MTQSIHADFNRIECEKDLLFSRQQRTRPRSLHWRLASPYAQFMAHRRLWRPSKLKRAAISLAGGLAMVRR